MNPFCVDMTIPSSTHVMQALVLGVLLTTTKQSKHTPMPQKIPRLSPTEVVRIAP